MDITQIKSTTIYKNIFSHIPTIDKAIKFKNKLNSNSILNIMNIKSLSQKAQISFCADNKIKKYEDDLIEIINNTPDDEINKPVVFFDGHFGARTYIFLIDAAKMGSTKAIELLRQKGADPNIVDNDNNTALAQASQFGQTEAIKALLKFENIDVNQANKYGETALMRAAEYGQLNVINALLEAENIDINKKDNIGETAMSIAKSWKHLEIAELLYNFSKKQGYK